MIYYFNFCCCDKNAPTKSNLQEKRFILAHNSRFQSITMRNPRRKKFETANYIASIGHVSREMNACMLTCTQSHLYTYIYSP